MTTPAPVISPITSDLAPAMVRFPKYTNVVVGKPAPACLPPFAAICGRKFPPGPQRTICMFRAGCISPECLKNQLSCMLHAPPNGDWRPCVARSACPPIQSQQQTGYLWNPYPNTV